ncbi:MAG: HAMP domain-containing histidine kinase [Oscillospiraceae bacterium]|nr:HAMP domain-containing histidine kinase [Oscillospiraceae bacterium]
MSEQRFRASRSLSVKLMLAALLSLVSAFLTYFVVFNIGTLFVDRYYMSTESLAARTASAYTDLYRYVRENGISGGDTEAIERFHQQHELVELTVYTARDLGLNTRAGGLPFTNQGLQSFEPLDSTGRMGRLYPLKFQDGFYYVSIADNSRVREDTINRGLAITVAVAVMISLLLWYTNRLTRRIIRLSQEAAEIGAGDLEGAITVEGVDELSALASDIDGMRDAIIERMGNEKRAWEANSELITAMSHDIRTPMTALIGYLGLLNNQDALSEDERHVYLEAAYGKSLALKELTDELFKYFLVFGRSELEVQWEDFDTAMLLMQLLGEAEFDLRDSGMQVESTMDLPEGSAIRTDVAMLKRVIDNLVSNLKKYADREQPVVIRTEQREGVIRVSFSNAVAKDSARMESTKIGLRTCEKILPALGGNFTVHRDADRFTAEFTLPAGESVPTGQTPTDG